MLLSANVLLVKNEDRKNVDDVLFLRAHALRMPSDARTPRGVAGGAEALSGLCLSKTVPSRVRGAHAVIRGSGKGGSA